MNRRIIAFNLEKTYRELGLTQKNSPRNVNNNDLGKTMTIFHILPWKPWDGFRRTPNVAKSCHARRLRERLAPGKNEHQPFQIQRCKKDHFTTKKMPLCVICALIGRKKYNSDKVLKAIFSRNYGVANYNKGCVSWILL